MTRWDRAHVFDGNERVQIGVGRAVHYKRMHLFHFEIIELQKSCATSLFPIKLNRGSNKNA